MFVPVASYYCNVDVLFSSDVIHFTTVTYQVFVFYDFLHDYGSSVKRLLA